MRCAVTNRLTTAGRIPVRRRSACCCPGSVPARRSRWVITLRGVDEVQRAKLAEIAERTPVTRAVRAGTEIRTITEAA